VAGLFAPPLRDIHFVSEEEHMAKLGHLTAAIRFMVFGVLFLASTSWAQTRSPIAEQIAKAYGLDSYDQVEAIRYTFNIRGAISVSRSWVWEPKTGQISYEGADKDGKPVKVTFVPSRLAADSSIVKNKIDWFFVNDNYWAFLPFHLYWDSSGANVQDMGIQKLPLGQGSAKLVRVKYPNGGYTPGDTWDLYVGSDNRFEEMVYHRGSPKSPVPALVTVTWAGYKKAGALLFSTEHRGTADGKPLHLFFSNVAVKLVGSDTWINAQWKGAATVSMANWDGLIDELWSRQTGEFLARPAAIDCAIIHPAAPRTGQYSMTIVAQTGSGQ
jgi:hypothetical protein